MSEAAAFHDADASSQGVIYLSDLVPSKRHFECKKIHGLLDTGTCAARWLRAKRDREDARFMICRGCVIGEIHATGVDPLKALRAAGQRAIVGSPDEGRRCTRCSRSGSRIVGGTLCVSCWNREREFAKGVNGKGTAPITFVPLEDRRVGIMVEGRPAWMRVEGTQNDREPVTRTIRQREGARFHGQHPGISTWNEWAQRWEYRDHTDQTQVLLSVEYDGVIDHMAVPAAGLRPGETPVTPSLPTQLHGVHFVAAVLSDCDDEDIDCPGPDWKPTVYVCNSCCVALVQARTFSGKVECRCPACAASST
ncbi:hypothetical protein [Pseudomonas brassicacearum]|uniref:Uncharacterized protein n=1 Tax=Pseudomonas brassicacearum TaxID=930166 RepID=A0A423H211_9PSED|nr:hypothetical protein [Pseudomonas brassicacearum]RON06221.1 hypothetical protein BK658_00070 [Pseudomonas brassicacearum]